VRTRQLESEVAFLRLPGGSLCFGLRNVKRHPKLKIMVPKELSETFWIPGGRGEGRAKYSNFRQFATSTRLVPQ